jgi:GTPase
MVIGNQGSMIKQVGIQARSDIERMLGEKIYLGLWVKVKNQWLDNKRDLLSLGHEDIR